MGTGVMGGYQLLSFVTREGPGEPDLSAAAPVLS